MKKRCLLAGMIMMLLFVTACGTASKEDPASAGQETKQTQGTDPAEKSSETEKVQEETTLEDLPDMTAAEVGTTITFGVYEQDNNTDNGKEEIEWLVLAKEDNRILVISKYALDCIQYNTEYEKTTWETSSLREWLNGAFFEESFNAAEQSKIAKVTLEADKNPDYDVDPGNSTEDRIFILSMSEADRYFDSDDARMCEPSEYATEQGVLIGKRDDCTEWWLRTPGKQSDIAAYVTHFGGLNMYGMWVDGGVAEYEGVGHNSMAVRPAMWIEVR
ncbi:MAG: hypothetical protein IJ744_05115 [Lachnospiraceae bacterium]|nr:hypothetical protein [Lachnospiraceae bacterium]